GRAAEVRDARGHPRAAAGVGGRGAGRERPQRLLLGLRGRRLGQEQARTHPHGGAGRASIRREDMISRSLAASLGREAVAILEAGCYQAPSGKTLVIRPELDAAVRGTTIHRPDDSFESPVRLAGPTRIEVTGESTLAAARRLDAASPGCDPCCLNFASAKHPGGGF